VERLSLKETVKDQWNRELEGFVRRMQSTDWAAVSGDVVDGAGRVWGRIVAGTRDGAKEVEGAVKESARGREG
jgi:hypothetical protein